MRNVSLLAFGAIAIAACAPTQSSTQSSTMSSAARADGRQCFADRNLEILQNEGSRSLYVRTATGEALRLDSAADCFTDAGAPAYDFRPLGGPEAPLCVGDSVRVDLRSQALGLRTCQATVAARLSDAEVAALPNRRRP